MTTGKTIVLTRRTFVGKVMSLLFNVLSRLVIAFLPKSKRLLISWLQSPSAVILEPKKIKSDTVSPSISHEVMGLDAMILNFYLFPHYSLTLSPFPFPSCHTPASALLAFLLLLKRSGHTPPTSGPSHLLFPLS